MSTRNLRKKSVPVEESHPCFGQDLNMPLERATTSVLERFMLYAGGCGCVHMCAQVPTTEARGEWQILWKGSYRCLYVTQHGC